MSNKRLQYYENDDVTLRGTFRIDGDSQTPDAGTLLVTIYKKGAEDPIVTGASGTIIGDQLTYKISNLAVGQYAAYLTAKYNSGADERTGVIEFMVRKKEAH